MTQSSGNSRAISSTPMYTDLDTVSPAVPGVEFMASSGRLGDDAYSLLKTRILRGEFPLNMRLVETRLAKELGLSRTPVREALARLAAESLLASHPDGGFQPRIPDTVAIRELYEDRAALETQALQRPGSAIEAINNVKSDIKQQSIKAREVAHQYFDSNIVLKKMLEQLN